MKNRSIIFQIIANSINIILTIFCFKMNIFICFALLVIYLTLAVYCLKKKVIVFKKFNKFALIILFILNLIGLILNSTNILSYLGTVHEIKNFILSTKEWGILVFCIIELLQIIALPIPGFLTILAGVNIWGVLKTILVCGFSVVLGSCIAFLIGKKWGVKAIYKLIGEKKYNAYKNVLDKHSKLYLSLMFIFPFFPDDLLCILAGTTNMKFYEFLIISVLTRPVSIIITALLGEYLLIIFGKFSIKSILMICGILCVLVVILLKNKDKILNYFKKKIPKKTSRI